MNQHLSNIDSYSLSYILNELGEDRENYYNSIAPPVIQTSNFAFKKIEDLQKVFEDEYSDFLYSRGLNPTVDILKKKIAALDGAEDALIFNSGASAIFASVLSQVKSGDHIVSVKQPYTWAQKMFDNILPRFGVSTTYIDGTMIDHFERAILPNTRLIYLESPNSWDFALQDLKAVADLAKSEEIITICDNSYSSPVYQRPITAGIDMVLQSATKYLSGHSDVVAGVLSGRKQLMKKIFDSELLNMGNGISPFNAWLLIRGLRTLPMRLERISDTTRKVIAALKTHRAIENILFPLDPSFPQYELACRQMTGACGLFTAVIRGNMNDIIQFCESLKHILIAVSWGGYESLVIPKCASLKHEQFNLKNQEHRMVRFYIGLEDAEYIISDINQALERAGL
ncbi:MAG TPA: PLP-dependent aspartate aminotransferase family protein [Flavitalea sp.]|nr:PLP-dependent aspartate aminotransferase family protein [Flavitalea sp.]